MSETRRNLFAFVLALPLAVLVFGASVAGFGYVV